MAEGVNMYKGDEGYKVNPPADTSPKQPALSEGPVVGPDGLDQGRGFDNTIPSGEMPPKGDVLDSPMDKP